MGGEEGSRGERKVGITPVVCSKSHINWFRHIQPREIYLNGAPQLQLRIDYKTILRKVSTIELCQFQTLFFNSVEF